MKIKDIEKKLRKEQDGAAVPDVYTRVKKAPLNKLLTGETPARAFRKDLAVWLLATACALFIVMAISISAMWFSSSDKGVAPDCYVSITIQRTANVQDGQVGGQTGAEVGGQVGQGDLQVENYYRIGALMRWDGSIISITVEMENGDFVASPMTAYSSQISDFIMPNANDKVSINVICEDIVRGYSLARRLVADIKLLCEDGDLSVVAACNDYDTQLQMEQFINAHGGEVRVSDGNAQLIKAYAALV